MRFGPFPEREIPAIETVLKNLNIPYTTDQDAELAEELLDQPQKRPVADFGEPATHYVEFDEADLKKLGDKLEPYGITQQSTIEPDFGGEDYFCPTCGAHSIEPGVCKRDGVQLVVQDEYKIMKRIEDERQMNSSLKFILLGVAAALVFFLLSKFR